MKDSKASGFLLFILVKTRFSSDYIVHVYTWTSFLDPIKRFVVNTESG